MEWYDVATILAAVSGVVWLVARILAGDDERHDEDAARRFFDQHGHWPDEDPAEAHRRYEL